jgi:hypothetical protein
MLRIDARDQNIDRAAAETDWSLTFERHTIREKLAHIRLPSSRRPLHGSVAILFIAPAFRLKLVKSAIFASE